MSNLKAENESLKKQVAALDEVTYELRQLLAFARPYIPSDMVVTTTRGQCNLRDELDKQERIRGDQLRERFPIPGPGHLGEQGEGHV